ncbi:hypothetical protein ACLB2K_002284 [Fragaria x ananassa]
MQGPAASWISHSLDGSTTNSSCTSRNSLKFFGEKKRSRVEIMRMQGGKGWIICGKWFSTGKLFFRHRGEVSCINVRWRVQAPAKVVAWSCNCSNCSEGFGTHTAKHTFCKVCGITSFYYPRSNPDGVAITYKCVDPGTLTYVEVKHFDGKNWENSYNQSNIASQSKVDSGN